MVADLEGFQHGAGRNLEGLNNEGADERGKQHGDDDRLNVFAGNRFAFALRLRQLALGLIFFGSGLMFSLRSFRFLKINLRSFHERCLA